MIDEALIPHFIARSRLLQVVLALLVAVEGAAAVNETLKSGSVQPANVVHETSSFSDTQVDIPVILIRGTVLASVL